MSQYLNKTTSIKIAVLAWYQIIGGILGLGITAWALVKTDTISGLILLIFLLAILLYTLSIYCGRLLLKQNTLFRGLNFSSVHQAIQVFSFGLFGWGFKYVSGACFFIGFNASNNGYGLNFDFHILSTWQINVKSNDTSTFLAINILALYLIYFIDKLKNRIEKSDKENIVEKTITDPIPTTPGNDLNALPPAI